MTKEAYPAALKFYEQEKARDERVRHLVEVILTRCDGITRDKFALAVVDCLAGADPNDPLLPPQRHAVAEEPE